MTVTFQVHIQRSLPSSLILQYGFLHTDDELHSIFVKSSQNLMLDSSGDDDNNDIIKLEMKTKFIIKKSRRIHRFMGTAIIFENCIFTPSSNYIKLCIISKY